MQIFIRDDEFVVYEMGYRITGSLEYKIIEAINGVNPMEAMVNYALTGKMSDEQLSKKLNPNHTMFGANVTLLANPGTIATIEGVEEVASHPQVLDVITSYSVGDTVAPTALGTLQQVVARAFMVAENKQELADLIAFVQNTIKVKNKQGESLLIEGFDISELAQ